MSEPPDAARPPSKRALGFVFATVLIDMIGFGIIIPVLPELIMELTGEGLGHAAIYGGWLMFVYALMHFFMAPVIGNLSDRFGRRPVLLLSLLAFGLDYLLMGLAPSLFWLFVGRFLAGIVGATYSTANAFIADVSLPEERAQNFGLMGAAFGIGFVVGPVIGGLLGEYGPRVPFFVAAGLALCNLVYGTFHLPETLPPEKRRPFDLRRANPVGALSQMRQYPVVMGLLGVVFLYQIAHDANPAAWSYYTMLKFEWSEREVGYSLGFLGVMIALAQGVLIRWIIPRLGAVRTAFVGYLLMAIGFLGFALAQTGWQIYLMILPWTLGVVAPAAVRGLMANAVPDDAQGELAGAISSLMSLTAIGAPVLMSRMFATFSGSDAPVFLPGAPFVLAALLVVGCVVQLMRVVGPRSLTIGVPATD